MTKDLDRVEKTWEEMGRKIRPLRRTVFVRTDPIPNKTESGLYIAPKLETFYGELPHVQLVTGTVLSSGPEAVLEPGEKIGFQRLFFARYLEMEDRSLVGWIADERNVVGTVEGDLNYVPMEANAKPAPRAPSSLTGGRSGSTFGGGSSV